HPADAARLGADAGRDAQRARLADAGAAADDHDEPHSAPREVHSGEETGPRTADMIERLYREAGDVGQDSIPDRKNVRNGILTHITFGGKTTRPRTGVRGRVGQQIVGSGRYLPSPWASFLM